MKKAKRTRFGHDVSIRHVHLRKIVRRGKDKGKICNTGGLTIATKDLGNGALAVEFAYCNWKDNFNRKIGAQVARGRLEKFLSLNLHVKGDRSYWESELKCLFPDFNNHLSKGQMDYLLHREKKQVEKPAVDPHATVILTNNVSQEKALEAA